MRRGTRTQVGQGRKGGLGHWRASRHRRRLEPGLHHIQRRYKHRGGNSTKHCGRNAVGEGRDEADACGRRDGGIGGGHHGKPRGDLRAAQGQHRHTGDTCSGGANTAEGAGGPARAAGHLRSSIAPQLSGLSVSLGPLCGSPPLHSTSLAPWPPSRTKTPLVRLCYCVGGPGAASGAAAAPSKLAGVMGRKPLLNLCATRARLPFFFSSLCVLTVLRAEKRSAEASRIRTKFPDRIPVGIPRVCADALCVAGAPWGACPTAAQCAPHILTVFARWWCRSSASARPRATSPTSTRRSQCVRVAFLIPLPAFTRCPPPPPQVPRTI